MTKRSDPFKDAIESPKPLLTLEYKPPATAPSKLEPTQTWAPPATAPEFIQTPTGKKITQSLKNLVNEIHAANPNKKMHSGTFRSKISAKLKELGVEPSHTNAYVKNMNDFYKAIYEAAHEIQPN